MQTRNTITRLASTVPPMDAEEAARRIRYVPVGSILHKALLKCRDADKIIADETEKCRIQIQIEQQAAGRLLDAARKAQTRSVKLYRWVAVAALVVGLVAGGIIVHFIL
jgi:hypothetical protein